MLLAMQGVPTVGMLVLWAKSEDLIPVAQQALQEFLTLYGEGEMQVLGVTVIRENAEWLVTLGRNGEPLRTKRGELQVNWHYLRPWVSQVPQDV